MIVHSFMHSYSYLSESLFLIIMQGANGDPGLPGEAGEPGQTGLPGKSVCIATINFLQNYGVYVETKKDSLWITYIFVILSNVCPQRIFACFYADTN